MSDTKFVYLALRVATNGAEWADWIEMSGHTSACAVSKLNIDRSSYGIYGKATQMARVQGVRFVWPLSSCPSERL